MSLMEKIFGDLNAKEVKKIDKIANQIERYDEAMQALTDDELRAKTPEFKERLARGETLDDLLPEAYAVCREASARTLGMKHFHVQLIGGIVLHQGRIAEMKTGEGKTLVATLPAYLNALEGKGVHIVTVNDYLAKRDAEWMGKLYSFLGLTVGCVIHEVTGQARKDAYMADITYGTNNEFGFDYLRDNMVVRKENLTQRELHYAIVDEVDSILIDEARTPLIISGRGIDSSDMYRSANSFVGTLINDTDFVIDEKDKKIALTEEGVAACEKYFGVDNFSDPDNMELNHYVMQALRANYIMKKNIDYIVQDGEVLIVDEFTGRLMYGRRFNNGLHQAIEAKENVHVRSESKTLATITLQNYFRMYGKLSGMTGTAKTEEDEFREIYNMDVVVIPTNMPVIREDLDDAVYPTMKGKFDAIVEKVEEAHEKGQPVLVGTISIEVSEYISSLLRKKGIKHNVLNAKQHEREASIIAEAGRKGAVTIATNMAGRGTDIILGGNPEFEARKEMKALEYTDEQINLATGYGKTDDEEVLALRDTYRNLVEKYSIERKKEHEEVLALGGLCIIGTEKHESRRIDNQLRGRAGRQGDPGVTQFCISLEDDLMRLFGGEKLQRVTDRLGLEGDDVIEAGVLTKSIDGAQKRVEGKNFGIRKYVLQYDNVMNRQREIIYEQRRMVLDGQDMKEYILGMVDELIDEIITPVTLESRYPESWDFGKIRTDMEEISASFKGELDFTQDEIMEFTDSSLKEKVKEVAHRLYDEKEAEIGPEIMREAERMIILRVVDNRWMDHIDAMDQLKSGIGLRAYGQQDPAAAYASEGFAMFDEMIANIREETVRFCYNVTVTTRTERREVVGSSKTSKEDYVDDEAGGHIKARGAKQGGAAKGPGDPPKEERKQETVRRETPKIGRNDPCPCGSGKKYKNCCGKNQ